ncbi:MAG: HDOD domain-containing protein [Desulfobacterales bacterium]|nr:HDOD domain-containing protein [Desulfobacterales bacterium]
MATREFIHSGIDLDRLDLPVFNRISKGPNAPGLNKERIDPTRFVKYIYKKMHENDSFLSFSIQIQDVNKILGMKYSSAGDIADVIIRDVALTTKLLKLVNSSFYGHFTEKGVTTVSEAMIILGTEEIKLAAASLKIYEFMKDIANIKILKDKTIKALQRSIVARQIAIEEGLKDAEAIQISAMLYDFGQYLVALFSPSVFLRVEILCDDEQLSREQASKSVIGVSYSEIGRFIASKWSLPQSIIHAMKPLPNLNMDKDGLSLPDLQRVICSFTNALCHIDLSVSNDAIGQKIMEITDRYKNCLEFAPTQALDILTLSKEKIKTHAEILNPGI